MAVPTETDVFGALGYLAVVKDDPSARPLTEEDQPEGALVLYYASDADRVPEAFRVRAITSLEWSILG